MHGEKKQKKKERKRAALAAEHNFPIRFFWRSPKSEACAIFFRGFILMHGPMLNCGVREKTYHQVLILYCGVSEKTARMLYVESFIAHVRAAQFVHFVECVTPHPSSSRPLCFRGADAAVML